MPQTRSALTLASKERCAASAPQIDLTKPFWLGLTVFVLTIAGTAHPQSGESFLGAALIIVASWAPAYIWTRRRMTGLPIFPVFALTYAWTFGLPLLYEHPMVSRFDPADQLFGAVTVTSFLLLSMAVWLWIRRAPLRVPTYCFSVRPARADWTFLLLLSISIAFRFAVNGDWLSFSPGVGAIIRALVLAMQALSCFVLSYRLGRGELTGVFSVLSPCLILVLVVVSLPSLTIVDAMATVVLSLFGYIAGGGKIPWLTFVAAIALFAFLHLGKAAMREHYWGEEEREPIQPWQYPSFFTDWVSDSSTELLATNDTDQGKRSLVERGSLMQLLLYEQTMSDSIPFLYGDTYAVIPQLLVPRILSPERATTHEGTYRLNMHYGFQTREETETTTIGFGLLNEAYANFGLIGIVLMAAVLGFFYGEVERLSASAPLLSFKGLFAITIASYCFQTEFAAGVYTAALSQSTFALLLLSLLIMRRNRNPLESQAATEPNRMTPWSGQGALSPAAET